MSNEENTWSYCKENQIEIQIVPRVSWHVPKFGSNQVLWRPKTTCLLVDTQRIGL